jgi:hypothetical protein
MADDGSSTANWPHSSSDLHVVYDPYNTSVVEAELGRDSPSNPVPLVSLKSSRLPSEDNHSKSMAPPWVDEKAETMSTAFSDVNLVEPSFDETVLRALCDLDVSGFTNLYGSVGAISAWLYAVQCTITAR